MQAFVSQRKQRPEWDVFDKLHPGIPKTYSEEFSRELSAISIRLCNASLHLRKELDEFSFDQAASLCVEDKIKFYSDAVRKVVVVFQNQDLNSMPFIQVESIGKQMSINNPPF